LKIPKSFNLLGRTIQVVDDPKLMQERSWVGSANYELDVISLQPNSESYQVSEAKLQQTFCHELAHFLLYYAGAAINHEMKSGEYIHKNEEFVDLLGSLIQQALSSMEYEES
jgi:predicted SprT family Zn-dependent metalloprotease